MISKKVLSLNISALAIRVLAIGTLLGTSTVATAGFDEFIDPLDGRLDASQWILNNAHGFMPVPLMVTDPSVGVGGGAALLFFHETDEQKAKRQADIESVSDIPPSVTGVVGLATSNGSKLAGVFHSGNWMNDRVRYLGGLFGAKFNLKYYPEAQSEAYDYDIGGLYFFQNLDARIQDTNFFLGADYTLMRSDVSFATPKALVGVLPTTLSGKGQDASVAIKFMYDNRNNQFSPDEGTKAGIKTSFHDKRVGSDFNYTEYQAYINHYQPINGQWTVAVRADVKSIDGEAPFYAKPFIDLRGIPAMRYQGDDMGLAEVQVNYALDSRWTLLGFTGAGQVNDNSSQNTDEKIHQTYGGGFRYLVARQLGFKAGIDVAKGPDEWATYIQFGSAW
ncbi:BamA/TamA family outer membrane protein [Photobacterium swingsii]|uniref:BamA/TamA family outer membrane protein n=1 Tax=Photobacterium swingsii TaxID=680026 RepID=UPI00352C04CC